MAGAHHQLRQCQTVDTTHGGVSSDDKTLKMRKEFETAVNHIAICQ